MKTSKILCAVSTLLALSCSTLCFGQNPKSAVVHKYLLRKVWSAPNTEINSAKFTADGQAVLFCRKQHEADGHEAEAYSEKELDVIGAKAKKDLRWADPEVVRVSIANGAVDKVDYGWSPVGSADGKRVFYVHQKKPISGKRVLAETQEGNEICAFDFASKEISVLAKPVKGYLDSPVLSPDGTRLAYEICDVVNGAYGGGVGVGIIRLPAGTVDLALKPAQHHKLFDLVKTPFWCGDQLIALRETPKTGGEYMADAYDRELLNLGATVKSIYKSKTAEADADIKASANPDKTISVSDAGKQLTLDAKTGKLLSSVKASESVSLRSPDNNFRLQISPNKIEVFDLKLKKVIFKTRNQFNSEAEGCAEPQFIWSADSTKLGVVMDKTKGKDGAAVFDHSDFMVLDLHDAKNK